MGTTPASFRTPSTPPSPEQQIASSKCASAETIRKCQRLQETFSNKVADYTRTVAAFNEIQQKANAPSKLIREPKYTDRAIPALTNLEGLSPDKAAQTAQQDATRLIKHFYHMEDAIRLIPNEIEALRPQIELGAALLKNFGQASSTAQLALQPPAKPKRSFLREWL